MQERKSSKAKKSPDNGKAQAHVYENDVHTGQKLDKLHDLMTQEYLIEEQVHNLDPTPNQVKVAANGYPSFMRESTARVKKPVPDLDKMVKIKKEYIPSVKKEFVEKVDDCDKLYKIKGKIIQEYVQDYTKDQSLAIDTFSKRPSKEARSSSKRSTGSKSSKNTNESSARQ